MKIKAILWLRAQKSYLLSFTILCQGSILSLLFDDILSLRYYDTIIHCLFPNGLLQYLRHIFHLLKNFSTLHTIKQQFGIEKFFLLTIMLVYGGRVLTRSTIKLLYRSKTQHPPFLFYCVHRSKSVNTIFRPSSVFCLSVFVVASRYLSCCTNYVCEFLCLFVKHDLSFKWTLCFFSCLQL